MAIRRRDGIAISAAGIGGLLFLGSLVLPLTASRVGRVRRTGERTLPERTPLTVVVPAYREAGVIADTVERLRSQLREWRGPSSVLVVASDEETARVAQTANATVIRSAPLGKADAVNRGVAEAVDGVVVLTDANCEVVPHSWPLLLREHLRLADLVSANKGENGGRERGFWAYEAIVKRASPRPDSAVASTLAVVGEFLAFRKADFHPIDTGALSDDLAVAIEFARRGRTVSVAPDIETLEPEATGAEQWERRIRIATGQLELASHSADVILRTPPGRAYAVHKLYRITVGAAGFWTFVVATAVLGAPWLPAIYLFGYGAAVAAYSGTIRVPGVIRTASAAVVLQAIPVIAAVRVCKRCFTPGSRSGRWRKAVR